MIRTFLLGVSIIITASFFVPQADASVRVNGYYRSNGTYVSPYYRTSPNSTYRDNYSYKGNYNPYTGNYGTRSYNSGYGKVKNRSVDRYLYP